MRGPDLPLGTQPSSGGVGQHENAAERCLSRQRRWLAITPETDRSTKRGDCRSPLVYARSEIQHSANWLPRGAMRCDVGSRLLRPVSRGEARRTGEVGLDMGSIDVGSILAN